MNRRGERVVMSALAVALVCFVGSIVLAIAGIADLAAFYIGHACFMMLVAIYLEVYSHRG